MNKALAYRAVRTARARGILVKPKQCERCGRPDRSTGRSIIHAHHHDYNRPLDVEWICAWCHRRETPLPSKTGRKYPQFSGEKNRNAKLTNQQAAEIRQSTLSSRKLSRLYGVDRHAIINIKRGIAYPLSATPGKGEA